MIEDIEFGVIKRGSGSYGGSGSCSMKWINGLYGKYNPDTRKYEGVDWRGQNFSDYKSGVLALATDQQESSGIAKGLRDAGFIKLGGFRSAHGSYNCNLWFCDPRQGKSDSFNEGKDYHFYPNPEVFGEMGKSASAGVEKSLRDELAAVKAELEKAHSASDKLAEKLAAADEKVAELKASLAERRSLERAVKSERRSAISKGSSKLALHSKARKANGVRMGRVSPR